MFHPQSLVVKCLPPHKWEKVGKRHFLKEGTVLFLPLEEDMALSGEMYSITMNKKLKFWILVGNKKPLSFLNWAVI